MCGKTIIKFIITIMTPAKTLFLIKFFTYCLKTSASYVNKSLLRNYSLVLGFFSLRNFQKKKVGSMKTVKSSLSSKYFQFGFAIKDQKLQKFAKNRLPNFKDIIIWEMGRERGNILQCKII